MVAFMACLRSALQSCLKYVWTLLKDDNIAIALIFLLLVSLYLYSQKVGVRKAQFKFHAKKNTQNRKIIQKIQESSSQDALHPLLHNRHLQTILPVLIAKTLQKQKHWNLYFKRTYVPLKDGGQKALDLAVDGVYSAEQKVAEPVAADKFHLTPDTPAKPIIIIVPGLTSSIDDLYIIKMARQALDAGYQCVVVNHRGAGSTQLSSPKTYTAANTTDLEEVLQFIQSSMNQDGISAPLFGVGFSLGSNILLKYLGERGANVLLKAAVSVHNPYNFILCCQNIEKELFGVYNKALTQNLKGLVSSNKDVLKAAEKTTSMRLAEVAKVKTVREFDKQYTTRLFNYPTVHELYRDSSCDRLLLDIKIPTFLMSSKDDPIATSSAIPYEECEVNDNLVLAVSEGGGHLGSFGSNFSMLYQKHVTAYCDLHCRD